MDPARIAELLTPFLGESESRFGARQADKLTSDDFHHISMYIDLLQRWNARINLTAVRDPQEIVTRHFGESLFAARHLFAKRSFGARLPVERGELNDSGKSNESGKPDQTGKSAERGSLRERGTSDDRETAGDRGRAALQDGVDGEKENRPLGLAVTVADIGSGAGFPGMPIKLWAPEILLTLVESNHKKTIFLRELARALTLMDINILNARAESLVGRKFDIVTLRAVERFESILPIAAGLVAPAGRLALLISTAQLSSAKAALSQLALRHPEWSNPTWQVEPIPLSDHRILAIAHLAG
jgi:16S rRNA G527 N7-methylase RsmG